MTHSHPFCPWQGANGWDLAAALRNIKRRAEEAKDEQGMKAAEAVEARIRDVSGAGRSAACWRERLTGCLHVGLHHAQIAACADLHSCLPSPPPPPAQVGYNYFRLHPKGVGLVCQRAGGLPPLTFVEEYFGEIHTPWRWFEIQVWLGGGGRGAMYVRCPWCPHAHSAEPLLHSPQMGSKPNHVVHVCTPANPPVCTMHIHRMR